MQDFWDIVREVIEQSDVVIEVLDARMPEQTRNRKVEKMVKIARKPLVFAVNKSDLITTKNQRKYRVILQQTAPSMFVSCRNRKGISFLKKKVFEIAKKRSRRWVNIGVIGYPNTGKSSLINALAGRKKAKVGSKPGFTRGVQWISAGPGIRLLDTPGVIPYSENNEIKQALTGVLDPSKIEDPEDVAKKIVQIFLDENKSTLEKLYKIEVGKKQFNGIINEIGTSRNMLKKGGVIDIHRVYLTIINDWQKGKLLLK